MVKVCVEQGPGLKTLKSLRGTKRKNEKHTLPQNLAQYAGAVCIPRYPPYLGARGTFSECTSGTAAFRICPGNSGYLGDGIPVGEAVWDARGSCARARACSGRVRMTGCALVRSARRRTPRQAPQPRRLHYVPEVYLGNQACDQRARRRRRTVRFL